MEKGKHNTKKTAQRVNEDKSSGSARKNGNPDNNKPRRNAHAGINYIQEQILEHQQEQILLQQMMELLLRLAIMELMEIWLF